ncbi:MAG: hypothetical protein OXS33_13190 [bacterium]|nr:hypothetical protein [bacterium]
MSDLAQIVEQVARDTISSILDPLCVDYIHPHGEWRMMLRNGRVADIEATVRTDQYGNNFWSQIHDRPGPEWLDDHLTHKWTVLVSDPEPEANRRRPVRQLVDALIPVLAYAEATGAAPEEMVDIANSRLVDVWRVVDVQGDWVEHWFAEARTGISFEEWVPLWAERSGFWNPKLLTDHFDDPHMARSVIVVKPPEPAPHGMVYTLGSVGGGVAVGDQDALRTAIQERINIKTGKDQLANAPDLKWLAVGLDGGHSAWQLNDHFGPETSPPYSFESVNGLTLGCFDEVWVIAPCGKEMYTVVRLAQQSRHIVRLTSGETSP